MLGLFEAQFSRETMMLNKILGKVKLILCKDCQKLTSNKDLRCKKCGLEHKEYMYERLAQEAQDDERAEWEAENDPEEDDY